MSSPNLNLKQNETVISNTDLDDKQFKKLLNKLTQETSESSTPRKPTSLNVKTSAGYDTKTESSDNVFAVINKELKNKIALLENQIKEKDLLLSDYYNRLAYVYTGFKVRMSLLLWFFVQLSSLLFI